MNPLRAMCNSELHNQLANSAIAWYEADKAHKRIRCYELKRVIYEIILRCEADKNAPTNPTEN